MLPDHSFERIIPRKSPLIDISPRMGLQSSQEDEGAMDIGVLFLTALSELAQWIVRILLMVFVKWWLNWIRRRVADAIVASDFKVTLVTGVDPLRLRLRFKFHNGSASSVQLNRLIVHLSCGGAPIGSVVGTITENPCIQVGNSNLKIGRGRDTSVTIDFTPDIYLWFWLLPNSGYHLNSSSVEVSTTWGIIRIPLEGDVTNDVSGFKSNIDDFLRNVRARLLSQ